MFSIYDSRILNTQTLSFWTPRFGEAILGSLTRMMDADGERHENETYWIEAIKKAWNLA